MLLRNALGPRTLLILLTAILWSSVFAGLPSWNGAYARDEDYPGQETLWASESRNEDYPDLSKLFSSNEELNSNESREFKSDEDFFISFDKDRSSLKENELDDSGQFYDRPWMKGKMVKMTHSLGEESTNDNNKPFTNRDRVNENQSSILANYHKEPNDEQNVIEEKKSVQNSPCPKEPCLVQGDIESHIKDNPLDSDEGNSDSHLSKKLSSNNSTNILTSPSPQSDQVEGNKMSSPSLSGDQIKDQSSQNIKRESAIGSDHHGGNITELNSNVTGKVVLEESNNQLVPLDGLINVEKEDGMKFNGQPSLIEDNSEGNGKGTMLKNVIRSSLIETGAIAANSQMYPSSPNRASRLSDFGKDNNHNNLMQNQNGFMSSSNFTSPSETYVDFSHKGLTNEGKQTAQLPPISYKIPDHSNVRQKTNVVNSKIFAKPPIKDLVEGGRKSLNIQPIAEKPENFESQNVDKSNNRQVPHHNATSRQGSYSPNKTFIIPATNDGSQRYQKWSRQAKGHTLLKKSAEKAGVSEHNKPAEEFYSFPRRSNHNSARFANMFRKAAGRYSSSTRRHKTEDSGFLAHGLQGESAGGRLHKGVPPSWLRERQQEFGGQTRHADDIPRYGDDVFAHPLTADDPELDIVGPSNNKAKVHHHRKPWAVNNSPKIAREVN